MSNTDPDKFCRDIDQYEKALVTAIDELYKLETDGIIGKAVRQNVWFPLIEGLYKKKYP